jgi:hypothetical protein
MLTEFLLVLWRRRGLVIVAFILALVAGGAVFTVVPPAQSVTAQVLFVPPKKTPGVVGQTNPLLNLGGSVAVVATAVTIMVMGDETARRLQQAGLTAKYTVEPNLNENAGPTLIVSTEGPTPASATDTAEALLKEIDEALTRIQDEQDIDADLYVKPLILTRSVEPAVVRKKQIQLAVLGFGGLLLAAIVVIVPLDRRRSRARRADPGDPADPPESVP